MKKTFISDSAKKTIELAKEFAKNLKGGEIILLNGEMGCGKTVFAKGVALGLEIKDEITSPTFTFLNSYPLLKKSGQNAERPDIHTTMKLYHFDFYRINSPDEIFEAGLFEALNTDNIRLIEWFGRIKDIWNCESPIRIDIKNLGKNKREITIHEA